MSAAVDAATILGACEWWQTNTDLLPDQARHVAYHFGEPCPYQVAACLLTGQPDPRELVTEWRVDLPFPDGKPPLSLNSRLHWAAHAGIVERIKAITRNAVRAAEVPRLDHVHVELHYRPKTNRFRDIDNIVATLKPAIDAMHQPDERSHWMPILDGDDPRFVTWRPPILHPPIKARPGAVWLILRTYAVSTP